MVLGRITDLKSDDRGLFIRASISKTQLGSDVHTLLKDDALDSFSIGYIPTDMEFDDTGVRKLTAVDLLEVSVVAVPMNEMAVVTGVKARFCSECGHSLEKTTLALPDSKSHTCSIDLEKLTFSDLVDHFSKVATTLGDSAKSLLATLAADGHSLNESKQQQLTALLGTFPGLDAVRSDVQHLLQTTTAPPELKESKESALALRLALAHRRLRAAGLDV